MTLTVGDPAPEFSLPDQDGNTRSLQDYRGQWLLVWFYPKADTPGWTKEGCGLRDESARFAEANCAVVGVSADKVGSQKAFATKYTFDYPLLSDSDKAMAVAYGAKGLMGVSRISVLIDPAGKVARVYEKVSPASHANDVLADLAELST